MLTEPNKHTWLGQDDLLDIISVMMLTLLNGRIKNLIFFHLAFGSESWWMVFLLKPGVEAVAVSLDGVQMWMMSAEGQKMEVYNLLVVKMEKKKIKTRAKLQIYA